MGVLIPLRGHSLKPFHAHFKAIDTGLQNFQVYRYNDETTRCWRQSMAWMTTTEMNPHFILSVLSLTFKECVSICQLSQNVYYKCFVSTQDRNYSQFDT